MFQLELFGGARISGPAGPLAGRVSQRRQLALLAFLALHDRPVTRDRLLAVFWPEADTERARHALSDALYILRKALGEDAVQSLGDDLSLEPAVVRSDVGAFTQALAENRVEAAVELYSGPFLNGFHLRDAPEFEVWQQAERDRLAHACLEAAEAAAKQRQAAGDPTGALGWWRRAAALEPHNSRVALSLARALTESGDRAGAIRYVDTHSRLLEGEYGIAPPADFAAYAAALRSDDVAGAGRSTSLAATASGDALANVESASDPVAVRRTDASRQSAAPPTHAEAGESPHVQRRRGWWLALPGLAALAILGTALKWNSGRSAAGAGVEQGTVVVLPFRVAGLHPDLAYLGEGMVDLLSTKLTGEAGGLRALPPSHVVSAARGRMSASLQDLAPDAALSLARQLGAAALLRGGLVGRPGELTVQATLVDARTGREIARADVHGTDRELHDLVDRLIGQILIRSAQEEEHRLADLTSTSLPALLVFLSARAAHRRGDYEAALRQYGEALELDSTFALAGLGVLDVAGWVGGSGPLARRGAAVANAHGHRLSERDRAARGLYPSDSLAINTTLVVMANIEDALVRFRDHPRLWYRRGDAQLHFGPALGADSWEVLARESFERAIELDPDFAEPVHHLATILSVTGDTAALRELADRQLARVPRGPVADYIRWLARLTIGPPFREPPLDSMHTDATLRWIGLVAQDYGLASAQAAAAVRLRVGRPGIRDEHFERRMGALSWALHAGQPAEAAAALRSLREVQPDPDFHDRIAILIALFADGDVATAAESARNLANAEARGEVGELNSCVLDLWRLRHEPATVPKPVILSEREALSPDYSPWATARRVCALLRDAQWLAQSGGMEWRAAIGRLDRLLAPAALRALADDGHAEYVHIGLARLHEAAGSRRAALDALRRRSYYNGWQPYLTTSLREEDRLATALGDTSTARRARQHLHALRAASAVPDR